MRTRASSCALALLLVALILTLTTLAYASPPDPTESLAFFDDNDFDEVVGYITSAAGLVQGPVVHSPCPVPVLIVRSSAHRQRRRFRSASGPIPAPPTV